MKVIYEQKFMFYFEVQNAPKLNQLFLESHVTVNRLLLVWACWLDRRGGLMMFSNL